MMNIIEQNIMTNKGVGKLKISGNLQNTCIELSVIGIPVHFWTGMPIISHELNQ